MSKPIGRTTSVGIGAQVDNLLDGQTFQFAPDTGAVKFYALTSAGDVRATIFVGTDLIADEVQLQVGTKINKREDLIAEHGTFKGEPLIFRVKQIAGAGAVNVNWVVEFEPLG
jgi:hypothetical protein